MSPSEKRRAGKRRPGVNPAPYRSQWRACKASEPIARHLRGGSQHAFVGAGFTPARPQGCSKRPLRSLPGLHSALMLRMLGSSTGTHGALPCFARGVWRFRDRLPGCKRSPYHSRVIPTFQRTRDRELGERLLALCPVLEGPLESVDSAIGLLMDEGVLERDDYRRALPPPDSLRPLSWGPFSVFEELGRGAAGIVYRASLGGDPCALKILRGLPQKSAEGSAGSSRRRTAGCGLQAVRVRVGPSPARRALVLGLDSSRRERRLRLALTLWKHGDPEP